MGKYLEEKISFHVPKTQPILLREALKYYIKSNTQEDLLEEFYREIQRETTIQSSTAEEKLPWICHAATHRLVKDLVIYDASLDSHKFSGTIATILKKNLKVNLRERSGYIVVAFLENDSIKENFTDLDKKLVKKMRKQFPTANALKIIEKKL